MKILMTGVDGVLNSAEWFASAQPQQKDGWGLCSVDPKALQRIKYVCKATGAKIVLSSTWRLAPQMVEYLTEVAKLEIYDMTPRIDSNNRAEEIMTWLKANPYVYNFAIIDDDEDAGDHPELKPRFVRTSWQRGMEIEHEEALLKLLGKLHD